MSAFKRACKEVLQNVNVRGYINVGGPCMSVFTQLRPDAHHNWIKLLGNGWDDAMGACFSAWLFQRKKYYFGDVIDFYLES